MKITFNNVFNKTFDKQPLKQYNNLKPLQADTLQIGFGGKKLDSGFNAEEAMKKLKTSKYLANSPVSYMLPLLENYLVNSQDENEFYSTFVKETQRAQFIFTHFPQKEIENNRKMFMKELVFAENIYQAVVKNKNTGNMKAAIQQNITDYLQKT